MAPKPLPAILCLLMAAFVSGQVEVRPLEAVIVEGGNVSMVCRVAYPVDSCRIRVAGVTHILKPNRDQSANLQYYGSGLEGSPNASASSAEAEGSIAEGEKAHDDSVTTMSEDGDESGECGVVIHRVDRSMNGNITCSIPSQSSSAEIESAMRLVIAQAPSQPQLSVSPGGIQRNVYRAGDTLQARCEVPHGRPPAKLSWYLGDAQLLDGLHQVVILDEPLADLKTVAQNLTRVVQPEDGGKTLTCKAEHVALAMPYNASRQLDVQYPPQRLEAGPITIFGVKLREDGLLNVTVRANPAPAARWSAGDVRLNPGELDHDGKFEARHLQPLGNGFYVVSLLIRDVEKVDVERTYLLDVSNEHGREEFNVRISTSDEPEGVQLDTGSIVGIVVAVLVVLIAVFLVLFARATNRWCFHGRRFGLPVRLSMDCTSQSETSAYATTQRNCDGGNPGETRAKSSGESSDTESAVGGARAAGGRLAGRLGRALPALRAALPGRGRGKDRVAQAQPGADVKPPVDEEKPLQEGEKKSVVYAELSLAQPNAPAPTKTSPESTEYAEIVYGSPPEEAKKEDK